jgi:hypothetical protein
MDYPDKGVMGLARHKSSGEVRLGLSATAGSAVLYSAIVLFGVGSASPSAPDAGPDRRASAVLIPGPADFVSGSVQRLPQASPEPGRNRPTARPHRPRRAVGSAPTTSPSPSTVESPPLPAPPRATESVTPTVSNSSASAVEVSLPAVPLPDAVAVIVPAVPALPVLLPELPALPALPLDLPG